jgi:hypothetical protein
VQRGILKVGMPHITSTWARDYGLPDPATPASEITRADADLPAAAARVLGSVALAARFGRERARAACGEIESGWSSPRAQHSLTALVTLSLGVEQACDALARACALLAEAIAQAHADVDAAYAAADEVIARSNLAAGMWAAGPDEMLRIDRERCALVHNLNAAFSAIGRTLDAAAAGSRAAMEVDPGAAVPSPVSPAVADRESRTMSSFRADLRSPTGRRHRLATAVSGALQQARAAGLTARLVAYEPDDPAGQGAVAICVGDMAEATSVAVLVPGVGNSPAHIADSIGLADALNASADHAAGRGGTTATVLWFGYDIPLSWMADGPGDTPYDTARGAVVDSVRAIDASDALQGGISLATFVQSIRPMMRTGSNLTLVGHSYGSTTVAQAARTLDRDAGVDDIVLLGSPGVGYGITTADDLRAVDADHVFSLSFPLDPVPAVGRSDAIDAIFPAGGLARAVTFGSGAGPFGPHPGDESFGATVIAAPSNEPVDSVVDFDQHALSNYLSGSSLAAVGAVTAARYQQVPVRRSRS